MKRKSLEKAVLLTVMLMSLNNIAGAESITESTVITEDKTVDSVKFDDTDASITGAGKLTVTGSDSEMGAVVIKNSDNVVFSNTETVIDTNADKKYGFYVYGSEVTFENGSKLYVTKNNTNASQNRNAGIYVSGSTATLEDAEIIVTGSSEHTEGVYLKDSDFNAKNLTITVNVDENAQNKDTRGIIAENNVTATLGIVDITLNGTNGKGNLAGISFEQDKNKSFTADSLTIDVNDAQAAYGVYVRYNATQPKVITSINGDIDISVTGLDTSYGISLLGNNEFSFAGGQITAERTNLQSSNKSAAIYNMGGKVTSTENLAVTAEQGIVNNGIGTVTLNNLTADAATAIANTGANVTVNGNAVFKNAEKIVDSNTNGTITEFKNGFITQGNNANQVISVGGSTTKINSSGKGLVQFTGSLRQDASAVSGEDADGTIDMNLTTEGSYWNLNDTSTLNKLTTNNAIINMTADNGKLNTLTANTLEGTGNIKMDIDASNATADRLYVDNFTGTQNIDLNVLNATNGNDNVVNTVLASVGSGDGTFVANDVEGALYWESYSLDTKENTDGNSYNTDWYISGVEQQDDKGTTSVDTIVGANALNYQTWRAENDQLMQRMGELRANGADEQGAWFRVHGAEISHDDIAGFENKYTTYELGYDQITKQTEDMTRYTGAALSYTDGSSSYDSGNGENHSKALSFYNTDIYDSGHYLDLVFKFANMDNDFSVYDTKGQNITGEYKNNGISLSAEYGRKNEMANGWYVEPQAQVTIGYFGGDEYETSNGVNVDQSGIASVLGRVGFNIGKQFGDNGVVYAKANLLHEFAGDYDIDMTDSTGNRRTESASFNDTWFEYGVGAALKTGKNNHLYFDFVKTAGGDFEKDWQWNAGMRWTF